MRKPFLITGATGNTGRHLVEELLTAGAPVRALVRDPGRARLPEGVETVTGDLTDPQAVAKAARGTAGAYLLWPSFDADGAGPVVDALTREAPRVVYLSATGASDPGSGWGQVEEAVRGSGREYTFLRVTGLSSNTLQWADQLAGGVVRAPFGQASRSLVHERDVAAVAARALLEDDHVRRSYTVSGPESIRQADQVRIIGEEIGVPVRWEEQPEDEAREAITAAMGPEYAELGMAYWAGLVEEPEPVSATVETVTGRPALTFRQWAREHTQDFAAA